MKLFRTADDKDSSKFGSSYSYDPNFHGPIQKRRLTDVICLVIFFLFIILWVVLGLFGFLNGQPRKIIYPTDSRGRECGVDELKDLKYLYYFDIVQCARAGIKLIKGCPTPQVCVSECPNITRVVTYYNSDKSWLICSTDLDPDIKQKSTAISLVKNGDCAPYVIPTRPIFGRCVPAIDKTLTNVFIPQLNQLTNYNPADFYNATKFLAGGFKVYTWGQQIFYDFVEFWWMYLISLCFSMFVALVWIILMRCFAGFMVALSFFIVIGLLSFGTYYSFMMYNRMRDPNSTSIDILVNNFRPEDIYGHIITDHDTIMKTWLIFGIILASLLGILIIITIFCIKRIRIAVALIREGSKAISLMLSTLFWPIIPFILEIGITVFWAVLAVYLASTGQPVYQTMNIPNSWALLANPHYSNSPYQPAMPMAVKLSELHKLGNDHIFLSAMNGSLRQNEASTSDILYTKNFTNCDPKIFKQQLQSLEINPAKTSAVCQFVSYDNHPWYIYMQLFNLFGLFWTIFFVISLNQITLAGAFSSYYWARQKPRDIPLFVLFRSLSIALIYHVGSLAFGSLLLAITKMIRVLLEYANAKAKETHNEFIRGILWCIRCCCGCFEKFLRFLNKNAFIMMAIHGKNFCHSAADAFNLLMRNVIRVVILSQTIEFLLFLGRLVVMAATGYFFYFLYSQNTPVSDYVPKFRLWEASLAIQIIGAYFVSSIFFGVYEMAVQTLFLCFLEDCERNDGSPSKPYLMSQELRNILNKKNLIVTHA